LLVLLLFVSVVATAQSDSDLKTIVGTWSGTGFSPAGRSGLTWTIKEDGSVAVLVQTPQGVREGAAKVSVKDGKFFYESATSPGPVTVSESGGRRTLKYEAAMKRDGSRGGADLTFEK
jgi:hypothetical protein